MKIALDIEEGDIERIESIPLGFPPVEKGGLGRLYFCPRRTSMKRRVLLLAAILSDMATSEPLVQIQPSALDVAATGVYLASLDDIGHTATVEAIVGQDSAMLASILPYGVLIINRSSRKLRAVGIKFQWTNTGGHTRSLWLTLASTENPSTFIAPRGRGSIHARWSS